MHIAAAGYRPAAQAAVVLEDEVDQPLCGLLQLIAFAPPPVMRNAMSGPT